MNYQQALEYIHSTLKFGSKPGLSRIRALMRACGNPQQGMKFVHITGTNGKGSTTTMAANILRAAGYRVGLFISPYVDDFRERMQVNGEMIPREELVHQVEALLPAIEAIKEDGHTHPTEFEIVTALAFNWFAAQKCDIVALEVGMGGRLDCTNIIDAPEVAALTPVALDHMKVLGNTVAEIAQDKCGIIKPGCDCVTCFAQTPDALTVIRADCASKGVPLFIPKRENAEILKTDIMETMLDYDGMLLRIHMPGDHQIQNTLTAVTIARRLQARGWKITDAQIAAGVSETRFNGRMEVIRKRPLVILDGGHNPNGADAVAAAIDNYLAGRRLITVMGMCADKDTTYCIRKMADRSAVFIGTQSDIPRALDAKEIAHCAVGHAKEVHWNGQIATACRIARELARPEDVILVCGSLYLLHDAREVFCPVK